MRLPGLYRIETKYGARYENNMKRVHGTIAAMQNANEREVMKCPEEQ